MFIQQNPKTSYLTLKKFNQNIFYNWLNFLFNKLLLENIVCFCVLFDNHRSDEQKKIGR
ncbi:hypothetical protein MPD5_1365 [Melissococcus plutonius DAT561]|nr:hypothetical protein MPD5_1365 [Melissococcus plutonius DAT561]